MRKPTICRGFRPGPTQIGLQNGSINIGFKKNRICTTCICVAKTQTLISCAVTAQLLCVFVFFSGAVGNFILCVHVCIFILVS